MWAMKVQVDFNFPYLIIKYLFDCSLRKDIRYLPYSIFFTPFFQKAKLRVNEEMQIIMPNATTMIIISNLHKMHFILGCDECWVRAHIIPIPSIPLIIEKGSTTQAPIRAPGDMTIE